MTDTTSFFGWKYFYVEYSVASKNCLFTRYVMAIDIDHVQRQIDKTHGEPCLISDHEVLP